MTDSSYAALPDVPMPDKKFLDLLAWNEKMAELGRICAGIIHEVNTPLSVIISAAQLALRDDELPETSREMVDRIYQEAQRLSQMTRGILSFARRHDTAGETDICQTVHGVVTFLTYEIQKRSIKVTEQYGDHLPLLPSGGNRLKQVVLNLVMNALQAMDAGGRLTCSCVLNDDGDTEIRIADTGPGIAPESASRIFDPFYTTKGEGEGTGLGLFVSRNLVHDLGGTLTFRSVPGEGCVFIITFPPSGA